MVNDDDNDDELMIIMNGDTGQLLLIDSCETWIGHLPFLHRQLGMIDCYGILNFYSLID